MGRNTNNPLSLMERTSLDIGFAVSSLDVSIPEASRLKFERETEDGIRFYSSVDGVNLGVIVADSYAGERVDSLAQTYRANNYNVLKQNVGDTIGFRYHKGERQNGNK